MGGTIAVKEGDLVTYVDAHQLAASLRKTSTLRRGDRQYVVPGGTKQEALEGGRVQGVQGTDRPYINLN